MYKFNVSQFTFLLSFLGGSLLLQSAIAPQVAQASTAQQNISISRQVNESYDTMVRRAEAVARAATQRSLDRDRSVTNVAVTILGENGGSIAPLLSLKVSRQAWKNRPDSQPWATYFPSSRSLLGLTNDVTFPIQPATTIGPGQPVQTNPLAPIQTVPNQQLPAIQAAPGQAPAATPQSIPPSIIPGSTIPGSTVPGSTVPGSTVPGSTIPGSTVPGSTVPGSTVPGSTVPGSTVPGSTIPGSTIPGSTIPTTP